MITDESGSVEIGHEFPTFERVANFASWNRFAAVNDEFVAIHMDDEAGRSAGFPAAIGMGNLTLAYVHVAVHRWLGEDAAIQSAKLQYRRPAVRGGRLGIAGVLRGLHPVPDAEQVDIEITVTDHDGTLIATGAVQAIASPTHGPGG